MNLARDDAPVERELVDCFPSRQPQHYQAEFLEYLFNTSTWAQIDSAIRGKREMRACATEEERSKRQSNRTERINLTCILGYLEGI